METDSGYEPEQHGEGGLIHREIATLLGIGRARVFYLEQQTLRKLKEFLTRSGIHRPSDFDVVSIATERINLRVRSRGKLKTPVQPQYSPLHGWLVVDRIVSINGGSEDVEDVTRAFMFLKERNEADVRPPVIIRRKQQQEYLIQAVAEQRGELLVRCWPTIGGVSRSVAPLASRRCTAVVESEYGEDHAGSFDIPVLI